MSTFYTQSRSGKHRFTIPTGYILPVLPTGVERVTFSSDALALKTKADVNCLIDQLNAGQFADHVHLTITGSCSGLVKMTTVATLPWLSLKKLLNCLSTCYFPHLKTLTLNCTIFLLCTLSCPRCEQELSDAHRLPVLHAGAGGDHGELCGRGWRLTRRHEHGGVV